MSTTEKETANPVDDISARLPVTDRRGWALLAAVALLVLAGLLFLHQTPKAPAQDLFHHPEVVARRDVGSARARR